MGMSSHNAVQEMDKFFVPELNMLSKQNVYI